MHFASGSTRHEWMNERSRSKRFVQTFAIYAYEPVGHSHHDLCATMVSLLQLLAEPTILFFWRLVLSSCINVCIGVSYMFTLFAVVEHKLVPNRVIMPISSTTMLFMGELVNMAHRARRQNGYGHRPHSYNH